MSIARFFRDRRHVRPARTAWARPQVELLEGRDLPSAAPAYVRSELLVNFKPGVSQTDMGRFYADHGLSERSALDEYVPEHLAASADFILR